MWLELDYLSNQKIDQIRERILDTNGYLTVIKSPENVKSSSKYLLLIQLNLRFLKI